jgi:hypothetical protein
VPRGAQRRQDAEHRSPARRGVVDERKGQPQVVRKLPDGKHLVARGLERLPAALREGLPVQLGQCLGRPEAGGRAPDEQHAGQGTIRHGSV